MPRVREILSPIIPKIRYREIISGTWINARKRKIPVNQITIVSDRLIFTKMMKSRGYGRHVVKYAIRFRKPLAFINADNTASTISASKGSLITGTLRGFLDTIFLPAWINTRKGITRTMNHRTIRTRSSSPPGVVKPGRYHMRGKRITGSHSQYFTRRMSPIKPIRRAFRRKVRLTILIDTTQAFRIL
ncbi:MAG: hypothetical protein AB1611_21450 [bacterium]